MNKIKKVNETGEMREWERERAKERGGERDVVLICKKSKSGFLNAQFRQQWVFFLLKWIFFAMP